MNIAMNYTVLMPLIILFGGITLTAFMGVLSGKIRIFSGVIASMSLLGAFFWIVTRLLPQLSDGPISFQDGMIHYSYFSVFLSLLVLIAAIAAFAMAEQYLRQEDFAHPEFHAVLLSSISGMLIMVNTANFVNIFVGLEILSIPLYASVAYFRYRTESVEGGLKYFIMGAIASGFLAYGIALIYGASGALDFAAVAAAPKGDSLFKLGLLFVLIGFTFKASAVPFHMWTPDAYEGAPTPVTALMSIAPKAVAIGVLLRILYTVFPSMHVTWQEALVVLSVLTVIVGNLGAIVQESVKRMLAYSSIAHAGYLLMGVVAFSQESTAAVLFYLAGYLLINTGAFGVLTLLKQGDFEYVTYDDMRGVGYRYPLLGLCMSIFMFALAGIPATIGFMGKFYVFQSLIHVGRINLALVGILGSLLSVYYYLRVVVNMYMKENPEEHPFTMNMLTMTLLGICSVFIIAGGLFPAKIADFATIAARLIN